MIPASLFAAAVYLLPVVGLLVVRSRRDRTLWDLAADVVLAVAADLLGVLLLTRFMRLEVAAIVSRILWLLALGAAATIRVRAGDRPRWPAALDRSLTAGIVVLMVAGAALSMTLSRTSLAWDRDFHIPMVASLRGQKIPFVSMYQPQLDLAYHFTGDVQAAMLQTYSAVSLHAALAVSLAHDLMFALLGAVVGLAAGAMGIRRPALQVAIFAAILLAGPMTLGQAPKRDGGYSVGNMFSLSYRPHSCLSFVLTIGFVTAILGSVFRQRGGVPSRLYPSLLAATGLLALTDESTLVLLGIFLGVAWLHDPACLAPTRRRGALKLALLIAAIGGAILIFGGPLGLHAERYPISLVAPRSPGWDVASMPLTTAVGRSRVVEDLFSILGVLVAALFFVVRPGQREIRTLALAFIALAAGAIIALTCFDFNHRPVENHRWVTAAFLLAPLVGAFLLVEPDPTSPTACRTATVVAMVIYVSNGLAMACSVDWMVSGLGARMRRALPAAAENLYGLDCRELTGTRLGERAAPTYVDRRRISTWVGCHATMMAGPASAVDGHKIKTNGGYAVGQAALDDLSQNILRAGQPLRVACLTGGGSPDPICTAAQQPGVADCKPAGSLYTVCQVAADQRARLGMR